MKWARDDLLLNNPFGEVFYVDYLNGSDSDDGKTPDSAFKTLGQAHTAVTTNKGDTVYLNGSTGTHIQEAAMLTWSKNRVSVIGIGPAGAVDPQPEIQLSSTANAADNAATIKVTGYGNSFTNCYFSNAGTHANSLSALWDAGENNVYTNCQFAKFSDLGETAVANAIVKGDTSTFRNCKFGVAWVTVTAAQSGMLATGTSGDRMKHNYFENCYWVVTSTSADYDHIRISNSNSLAFENVFVNPTFVSSTVGSGTAPTVAVDAATGMDGDMLFINPASDCGSFCTSASGVKVVGPMTGDASATMGIALTPD